MCARTSSAAVAALVVAIAGACGQPTPAIEICGRGSRTELRDRLAGGSLELRFLDATGQQVGDRRSVAAELGGHLDVARPAAAVTIDVTGFAAGTPIAHGRAALDGGGGACVCLALAGEEPAVCADLTCVADRDVCRFYDASGTAVIDQVAALGEGASLRGVALDTYLRSDAPDEDHGGEDVVRVKVTPATVGLLRFDLTSLPPASTVTHAELHLAVCPDPVCETDVRLGLHAVLEDWSDRATWNQRTPGVAWLGPGASGASSTAVAAAELDGLVRGDHVVELTALVAGWVASPASNFGLALVLDSATAHDLRVFSSEAVDEATRPRLVVSFRVP